jgi:hypothetical protein
MITTTTLPPTTFGQVLQESPKMRVLVRATEALAFPQASRQALDEGLLCGHDAELRPMALPRGQKRSSVYRDLMAQVHCPGSQSRYWVDFRWVAPADGKPAFYILNRMGFGVPAGPDPIGPDPGPD